MRQLIDLEGIENVQTILLFFAGGVGRAKTSRQPVFVCYNKARPAGGRPMLANEELVAEAAQMTRLAGALSDVIRRVPLYRGLQAPLTSALSPLGHLPCMTKAEIRRDFPRNFLGPGADLDEMVEEGLLELEHTSGTSEPRTPLLLPRGWWAEQERQALRLNAVVAEVLAKSPEARRVTINSPACSSDVCFSRVPTHRERTVGNTLFLSLSRYPFLWNQSDLSRMARETAEWQPEFLDVDPVYGVVFARYCEQQGVRLPSLKFILSSYEFVSCVHRRILQRVFNVPVFNLYGSTETGHLLMEDETGDMRASPHTAYLEVAGDTASGDERPSQPQELIVTTLTNQLMPLVRYRIGDLVERRVEPYHTRYVVHGRHADAFHTPNGGKVTTRQVDECFEGLEGFAHYQLIESADRPWLLRFVPDRKGPLARDLPELTSALQELLELSAPPKLESTPTLLAENSGKFRLGYPRQEPAVKTRM